MKIKKLSPERFTFDKWEANYSWLCAPGSWTKLGPSEEDLIEALERCAIGYCDASELRVRPKSGMYAVMCEDQMGDCWFHVKKETLDKILNKT